MNAMAMEAQWKHAIRALVTLIHIKLGRGTMSRRFIRRASHVDPALPPPPLPPGASVDGGVSNPLTATKGDDDNSPPKPAAAEHGATPPPSEAQQTELAAVRTIHNKNDCF